jgi:hypothetical protein
MNLIAQLSSKSWFKGYIGSKWHSIGSCECGNVSEASIKGEVF